MVVEAMVWAIAADNTLLNRIEPRHEKPGKHASVCIKNAAQRLEELVPRAIEEDPSG